MTSAEIRSKFLAFFESKGHFLEKAAPIVVHGDPTLMFTNAGMNQFKELFLGNQPIRYPRIADTQPCLRVSGKHNDLEDVGHDTYHHTLFEMLGNWSFGDYFKEEAISWAWELLTEVYKLPKDRLYVTVFGGDPTENLELDTEAKKIWSRFVAPERILHGSKKDNFWEMGDTGPCGPCSEIHIDLRDDEEIARIPGKDLVNESHPQVVEIWNLVFIQYNRSYEGNLNVLPNQHVDTGMGFERLCMAMQGVKSNYDTDVFTPLINKMVSLSGISYQASEKAAIAHRVIADHIRAVSFIIADGQLPSNNKAGYVCRRILRRAVRYGYTYLNMQEPFLFALVDVLAQQFNGVFPQITAQKSFLERIIKEEEQSFLRTLSSGLKRFETVKEEMQEQNTTLVPGKVAFELFDTFGFPIDLTNLIASENGFTVDLAEFDEEMAKQKARSRAATAIDAGDWVFVGNEQEEIQFVGYDTLNCNAEIIRHRAVKTKGQNQVHLVFTPTPFYAESGGQVGDQGFIFSGDEKIKVLNTFKENNLIIHSVEKLPSDLSLPIVAQVDKDTRMATEANHSATHLLHAALREVLGTHVEQKGSLVSPNILRFDFSHFSKMSDAELQAVENIVNQKIRAAIPLEELRNIAIDEAKQMGAMALFGEKYGDSVRVIIFDKEYSVELCGGTHVSNTSEITLFKFLSESSVASGVRRVECLTSVGAFNYLNEQLQELEALRNMLKQPKSIITTVAKLQSDLTSATKKIENYELAEINRLGKTLEAEAINKGDFRFIAAQVELDNAEAVKRLAGELKKDLGSAVVIIAAITQGKPHICVAISENLVKDKGLDAAATVRTLAKAINGGGGGQSFLATAGGTNIDGMAEVLNLANKMFA